MYILHNIEVTPKLFEDSDIKST